MAEQPPTITNLSQDEAERFRALCPGAVRVVFQETHFGACWGLGVEFADGTRHAMRGWYRRDRAAFLDEVATKLETARSAAKPEEAKHGG